MKLFTRYRDGILRMLLAVLVFAVLAVAIDGFGSTGNLYTVFESVSLTGIVAAGVAVTVLCGEFDLSVGSVAACSGVLTVLLADLGLFPAIAIATLLGILYGVLQGWAIRALGISSIVFTLGTFIGVRGLAYILAGETTVVVPIDQLSMSKVLREQLWIFSPFSLTMIVIVAVLWYVLRYTRLGREVYALGGARRESRAAGVPQARGLVFAFAVSGGLASLAGAMASMRASSAAPANFDWLLLSAVAATLIGGVSLYGGRGSVLGVIVGALTLQLLISGLSLMGAPFWAANLATGVLLMLALIIDLAGSNAARWGAAGSRFGLRRRPVAATPR